MERLSFTDQALHKLGTSGLLPVHMQGAVVVDPRRSPYPIDARKLAEHLASRLQGIPLMRGKLVQDPLHLGDVRLADDPDFDVWDHFTFATLPPPGDYRTLTRHLGRFSAEALDPTRPPWRFEIIDGLEGGRIAVAQKLSHATMDGATAIRVLGSLNDSRPVRPSRYRKRAWTPEPLPTSLALLGGAARESVERLVKGPRLLARLALEAVSAGASRLRSRPDAGPPPGQQKTAARRTSLNVAISSDRRNVAFTAFELDRMKALCRSLECTVNDLCLLMTSEALETYFRSIDEPVDFDLVVIMPINVRRSGDRDHGNAVTAGLVNLHNTIESLPERLRAIQVEARAAKDGAAGQLLAMPAQLADVGQALSPLLIDLVYTLLKVTQPWARLPVLLNTVMSNVAGSREALYLAGMPIELQIPMVPVSHTCALAVGAASMGNQLTMGFHACGRTVDEANMHLFVDGVNRAWHALTVRSGPSRRRNAKRSMPRHAARRVQKENR